MNIRDRRTIRKTADTAFAKSADALKPIVITYLAIITTLSLLASGLTVFLSDRIANTGGLGGMGLRSILSTVQTLLPWVQTIVLMGLQIGYCNVALRASRGEDVSRDTLFAGFRRFFPLLRSMLLQGCIYSSLGLVSLYLSVYLFLFLPVSAEFQELMVPLLEQLTVMSSTITLDEATFYAVRDAMQPVLWIFGVLFLILFIPAYYKYRLVMYRLVEHDHPRALAAMFESRAMMRRNRIALLKLDLSLWWFYLLQILIPLVCYGDVLLALVGIQLPLPEIASYFLFLILSLALQAVVYYLFMNRVSVTYAVAYDALRMEFEENMKAAANRPVRVVFGPKRTEPDEPSESSDHPWNDQY